MRLLLLQQEFDGNDWLPLDSKNKSQSFSRPNSQRVSANMRRKPSFTFGSRNGPSEEGSGSSWTSLLSSSRSPSMSIQSSARGGSGGGNQEDGGASTSEIADLPLPSRLPPPLPSCPPPVPIVPTSPPPLPPSQPQLKDSAYDYASHHDSIDDRQSSQLPSHPPPLLPSTPPPLPPVPPPPPPPPRLP